MNSIQTSIEKGAHILFYWGVLSFVFFMSQFSIQYMRRNAKGPAKILEKIGVYLGAATVVVIGTFVCVYLYTPHGEGMSQEDYQFSVTVITVLLGSSWIGIFFGYEKDKKLSRKERDEFKSKINRSGGVDYAEY